MEEKTLTSDDAELNLNDVIDFFRDWKILMIGLVFVGTAGALAASLILPKKYEAVVLLSPVANSSTNGLLSGLSSMVSQFSGLAALAGLSQNNDSTKSESLAALESEALTERYIKDNDLLPVLYPSKWDNEKHRWKDISSKDVPTLWKANQLFKKKIRNVSVDGKTGLVTLTITWTNAQIAAKWANDLVKMTNDYRRDRALEESERNIAYLTEEVGKTDVVGVKQAIYSVLQSEISKMMLAKGNEEFALKVIDPATAPEKAASPLPVAWTLIGFFGSVTLSFGIAFLAAAFRKSRHG